MTTSDVLSPEAIQNFWDRVFIRNPYILYFPSGSYVKVSLTEDEDFSNRLANDQEDNKKFLVATYENTR